MPAARCGLKQKTKEIDDGFFFNHAYIIIQSVSVIALSFSYNTPACIVTTKLRHVIPKKSRSAYTVVFIVFFFF